MPDRERTPHNPPEHLESLYLLAQALTTNAAEAARLVEATYRRAARQMASSASETPSAGHLEFARIMTGLARSSAHISDFDASISASSSEGPDEYLSRDFRRRAALRLTRQKLPAAFATLPAEARLLLLLCKVEQYSCADAGRVLDLTAEKACAQLDRAMQALRERLYENAAPAERALLEQALTDNTLRTVLRQMVASEFAAPPSSLREVATALGTPSAPTPKQPAEAAEATPQRRPDAGADGATRSSLSRRLQRAFLALLIIGFVGTSGYLAEQWLVSGPETNVVALSVQETGHTQAALQTNSTAAAELFVREQLGQRLSIPSIEGASLQSASIVEIASDVRIPVLRYEDTAFENSEEALITTYVYTYALLGEHEDRLQLDREILRQIGDHNQAETRTIGDQAVLIWRDRDEIFVATTPGDPEDLRGRLSF